MVNLGVALETWDFDACGERFLGMDAPAKEAPPLLFPPSSPPRPSRCAALTQLELDSVPSVSEVCSWCPSGRGHVSAAPTPVSGPAPLPP